jgi:probable HAF family extracellular repeat protein
MSSQDLSINEAGQVVGYSTTKNDFATHAFLYSGTTMKDLGALSGGDSQAQDINNNGQVVGTASLASGAWHAFLYRGSTMTDLNTLISPSSGWTLEQANGINDAGQIVGYGINPSGQSHAFLLTPVPEPSTFVLLGLGLSSVLAYSWRRWQAA